MIRLFFLNFISTIFIHNVAIKAIPYILIFFVRIHFFFIHIQYLNQFMHNFQELYNYTITRISAFISVSLYNCLFNIYDFYKFSWTNSFMKILIFP